MDAQFSLVGYSSGLMDILGNLRVTSTRHRDTHLSEIIFIPAKEIYNHQTVPNTLTLMSRVPFVRCASDIVEAHSSVL